MQIAEEGFSYHTFLLKKLLSHAEYWRLRENLFTKFNAKRDRETSVIYTEFFNKYGIIIRIKDHNNNFPYMEIRVNPRFIITTGDYSKIFPYSRSNVNAVCVKLNNILQFISTDLSITIDDMMLSRIDLSVNIDIHDPEITDAYIRVFSKCKMPCGYGLVKYNSEYPDYKIINLNSYRSGNADSTLTIYNKAFQLAQENLLLGQTDNIPQGLLRIEIELKRKAIVSYLDRQYSRDEQTLENALIFLGENSKCIMAEYLHKFYSKGKYLPFHDVMHILSALNCTSSKKEKLKFLVNKISECKNMNAAISQLKTEYNIKKDALNELIKVFDNLRINPVTLKNDQSKIDFLPSIFQLLGIN